MMIRLFNDEDHFINETVDQISAALPEGKGRVALSGGSTPRPVYKALPPFPNVEFFQVDERYVPRDHEDSNYRLIMETLKPEKFHFFDTSLQIDECLQTYEKELPDTFDLVILGIGPDGHTASLFPGSPALKEGKKLVAHTTTDAFAVHDRLTLTFPPILNARMLLVLLKGEGKKDVLDEFTSGKKTAEEFPAKRLLEHPNLAIHLLLI